ncbi:hypothetical protein BH24BAC1_BH24BAC1_02100 [soil metagenome]
MSIKGFGMAILLTVATLGPKFAIAQLREDFADGDFSRKPPWTGDTPSFIVNPALQLQSNGPAVTGTVIQLVTPSQAVVGTEWEFWANLRLATSSGNHADVFLLSDSINLQGTNSGYFVRLGGTPDEVSLFRKDRGGSPVYVINGRDGTLGSSTNNVVRVRVSRSPQYEWSLWIDLTGTGQTYELEGTATDATYRRSRFFGLLLRYSQANNRSFFFDDFRITDSHPPAILAVWSTGASGLEVTFTEPVEPGLAQDLANYTVSGGVGNPTTATLDPADPGKVLLSFGAPFPGESLVLTVREMEDLYGNRPADPLSAAFTYTPPIGFNHLLLTEIMAHESPAVGLPAAEYVELHNPTASDLNLLGLQLSDDSRTAILPEAVLEAGGYVILTSRTAAGLFSSFGRTLGLANFPSLNNAGDLLTLRRSDGKLVFAVEYADSWYRNPVKSRGGWALEMIDPANPCGGSSNWTASENPAGGTPGRPNSVRGSNPDNSPPQLVQAVAADPRTVVLRFNERLDSALSVNPAFYGISGGVAITGVRVRGPLFGEVEILLGQDLQASVLYTVTVRNVRDCAGNPLTQGATASLALPVPGRRGDVVINEVLFNPRPGGVDFVELVNRSNRHIDLQGWQLANARTDTASDIRPITSQPYPVAPGQYVVLTARPDIVLAQYPQANREAFLRLNTLPSYPNQTGTVVLLNPAGAIMDQFTYHQNMHFRLLDDVRGVSLERIRLTGDSSAANWQSAASTSGYATPGYRNSQARQEVTTDRTWTVDPPVFTPDGDGLEDFTTLNYLLERSGFVSNITIYDARGREIRRLVRNELLGTSGFFRWDGTTAQGLKVPVGYYVISIELFGLDGQTRFFKEKVVVGAR